MNDDYKWSSGGVSPYMSPKIKTCFMCGGDQRHCTCRKDLEAARREEREELDRIEREREATRAAEKTFIDDELETSDLRRMSGGQYACKWCNHSHARGPGVMVRRTGKYGVFYGCSNYPKCKFSYTPPGVEKPWTVNNDTNTKKKDKTMTQSGKNGESKTAKALDALKGEGKDAAWQVAANQTVKAAANTVTSVMKRKKMSRTKVAQVASLLETDIGKALFSFGLGAAISASPLGDGAKMKRLARELRVKAMREGGDMIADIASDPAIELIQSIVSDLPDVGE